MLGMRIVLPSLAPLPLLHAPLPLLRAAHPLLCSASDPSRGPGWADEAAAAALVAGTAIGGGFLARLDLTLDLGLAVALAPTLALSPTSYTLHPIPYTPYPTPYTPYPTPHTPYPEP